jgi:hypothetical protein
MVDHRISRRRGRADKSGQLDARDQVHGRFGPGPRVEHGHGVGHGHDRRAATRPRRGFYPKIAFVTKGSNDRPVAKNDQHGIDLELEARQRDERECR